MRRLIALFIMLWFALGVGSAAVAEELKLGLLHVNDTHGHLLPFRLYSEDGWGGFARLSRALTRQRADDSYLWLTLHAGDVFQTAPLAAGPAGVFDQAWLRLLGFDGLWGTPLSDSFSGTLDLECMRQMRFDALCLGNHEFDFGYDLLRRHIADTGFAVLCGNVFDNATGAPVAAPSVILQRGAYRIGILGLTTEALVDETTAAIADRVTVQPAIPAARELARELRRQGCAVVIALTHQGFERDVELARSVPELDVVVGGHSHTFLEQPLAVTGGGGNCVLVTQDGCYGRNLGVLRLTLARDDPSQRFSIAAYSGEFIPLSPREPQDGLIESLLHEFERAWHEELPRTVSASAPDPPGAASSPE